MWDTHDVDKNGWLDRAEAKNFIDAIASIIEEDRAKFYQAEYFDVLFDKFDEDSNGYLSKSEIAQFIKINFGQKDQEVATEPEIESQSKIMISVAVETDLEDLSKEEDANKIAELSQ